MHVNEPNKPGAGEFIETAGAGEDDEADLGFAKDGELIGLLEQPTPTLRECHLPARRVLDPLDDCLPSSHLPHPSKQQRSRERKSEEQRYMLLKLGRCTSLCSDQLEKPDLVSLSDPLQEALVLYIPPLEIGCSGLEVLASSLTKYTRDRTSWESTHI
jgi:hypothetical protein